MWTVVLFDWTSPRFLGTKGGNLWLSRLLRTDSLLSGDRAVELTRYWLRHEAGQIVCMMMLVYWERGWWWCEVVPSTASLSSSLPSLASSPVQSDQQSHHHRHHHSAKWPLTNSRAWEEYVAPTSTSPGTAGTIQESPQ